MLSLLKLAGGAALLYLAYCALLFAMQRQILFPRPQPGVFGDGGALSTGLEKVQIATGFGPVEAWFLPAVTGGPSRPAPAIIFGHGNGELIDMWVPALQPLTRLGTGLLLVEYPGYGRSKGRPSQKSITAAFVNAYDWLVQRPDVDPARVVGLGRSLGGGAVCQLAARRPLAAMILMSTFTGTRAFAKKFLAPPFLIRDPFDNLAVVGRFPDPVLIIHGRRDNIIPFAHARRLAAASPRTTLIAYDCGHNDCPSDWNRFYEDLEGFLQAQGIMAE
jgi:uncharacterized protein